MPLIEPKDQYDLDPEPRSIRIGKKLLDDIDTLAKMKGYSQSEFINACLKVQVREELAALEGEKKAKK